MTGSRGVSDEVWAQLDIRPRPASPRARRIRWIVTALTCVVILTWYLAGISGVTSPRLDIDNSWSATASPGDHTLRQELIIINDGWISVTVTGATSPIAELPVTATRGLPVTIGAGESAVIDVVYELTDCAALAPLPSISFGPTERVNLTVSHWWGSIAVPVADVPRDIAADMCQP